MPCRLNRSTRMLAGASRVAVLQAVPVNAGSLDVQAIAEKVGLHTTRCAHLDQLMDAGPGRNVQRRRGTSFVRRVKQGGVLEHQIELPV